MKTSAIREALAVLGDLVDVKMSEAALHELANLEEVLKTAGQWKADERAALRDNFAAAALSGLLANEDRDGSEKAYARDAYLFADAMLVAREGK